MAPAPSNTSAKLASAPDTRRQRPGHRSYTQSHDPASGGGRTSEFAGGPACLRRGPADRGQVARKKAETLPPLSDTLLPAEAGDVPERDELWSFVGRRLNARWVWIALCRQTRQVAAYFVGDRSADSACALRERIPSDDRCRATRSDFWLAYDEVFPWRTHPCTGKGAGETCHVERWNNTLRQRLARFVRKTLSFSRCERMHEVALRLTKPVEIITARRKRNHLRIVIAGDKAKADTGSIPWFIPDTANHASRGHPVASQGNGRSRR